MSNAQKHIFYAYQKWLFMTEKQVTGLIMDSREKTMLNENNKMQLTRGVSIC